MLPVCMTQWEEVCASDIPLWYLVMVYVDFHTACCSMDVFLTTSCLLAPGHFIYVQLYNM